MKAISIRQPWAWLIVNGFKDIENRSWETRYRGPVLVHASKTFDKEGYEWLVESQGIELPDPSEFQRGGIVGQTRITGCVSDHDSTWFFGPHGFVLADSKTLPFQPCKGALGFFDVKQAA